MWLGEQVTERGIGNGISMIIFASIVSGLPSTISQMIEQARQGDINTLFLLLLLLGVVIGIASIVFVERAQRRLVVEYPRRQMGRRIMQAQSSHLPLKLNMAGVIPAIFASSILLFPASISTWVGQSEGLDWLSRNRFDLATPFAGLPAAVFRIDHLFLLFLYSPSVQS